MSVAGAAELLGVSVDTIRRRIADGTLPAERIGPRLIRIRIADLDALGRPIGPGTR
ncbi:excisionase family DNA-binding protein [Microbacterium sp. CFBP 13617]|uniref:excisionase family DNA-binding protein n=1 Tax=Microbacterium sp. CFBP 13617 TaxID=2774035 RepID=UPI00177ECCD1|nr:excisionase family DNA-binding protein [Microbacterium sp. CFBP 13617]MBD8218109.1 excisionase family DNA-binding protein [Microbacterium sp. CFBP 13617]